MGALEATPLFAPRWIEPINAIEGRPASIQVPAEFVSLDDPARVSALMAAFEKLRSS